MEEWKKIQKTYKIRELIGITGMIMSFVIGAICDWNVLVQSNILIPIDDIEAFSLTIIQIQATVGTLIFTIIALITGNISDSYIGVSISDFYLNLKPWKLTQKVLIVVSLCIFRKNSAPLMRSECSVFAEYAEETNSIEYFLNWGKN